VNNVAGEEKESKREQEVVFVLVCGCGCGTVCHMFMGGLGHRLRSSWSKHIHIRCCWCQRETGMLCLFCTGHCGLGL